MTNIIIQIENQNEKTLQTIQNKRTTIAKVCSDYATNKRSKKTDEFRADLEANDTELFEYLYDEIGSKGKRVMSQHKRNISAGMVALGENTNFFLAAYDDANDFVYESKTNSFSKYKAEMNKLEKAWDEYADDYFMDATTTIETDETETDETETETDETETETLPEKTTLEQIYDVVEKLKLSDRVELRDFLNETIEAEQKELKQANG